MKTDVLVSGYVSMDHIIRVASPVKAGFTSLVTNPSNAQIFYGGCSVNIAYGLCRLGMNALPILRVGDDFTSNGFKQFLQEGNVFLAGITEVPDEKTSVCYLIQDNQHDHMTIFYPGAMDGKYADKMDEELFQNTGLGVITVASRQDNEEFFGNCVKYNVPIVFGMKDDFDAFPEAFLKEILLESEIIFTNEVEREIIERIYGFSDIKELFDKGKVNVIVTTLGKEGSMCYTRSAEGIKSSRIGIYPVADVVDATGSGDGYITGFLYGYINGYKPESCCRLGAIFSSYVLQAEGCCTNMPSEEQLLEKFKSLK